MTDTATAEITARVPDDLAVPAHDTHRLPDGRCVKISSLTLAGLLKILAAVRKIGFMGLPEGLTLDDLLTKEQRARLAAETGLVARANLARQFAAELSTDDKILLKRESARRAEVLFNWVCSSDQLLPVVLESVTDLDRQQVLALRPADALEIIGKAIALVDWQATLEAVLGFSSRIGGLMGALGRQSERFAAARKEAAE